MSDASPLERSFLPAAIRSARGGDPRCCCGWRRSREGFDAEGGDSDAILVATRCEDGGVPWPAGTPVAERRAAVGAALAALPSAQLRRSPPGVRARRLRRPVRRLAGGADRAAAPPLPDVSALVLSGDVDLRTPRSYALALAARLPHAQVSRSRTRATRCSAPIWGHAQATP